jgi:hypothetical protein
VGSYAQSLAKVVVPWGFNVRTVPSNTKPAKAKRSLIHPLGILALSILFGARFIAGVDETVKTSLIRNDGSSANCS